MDTKLTGRQLVEELYKSGFSDIAYQLAADLDMREAILEEEEKYVQNQKISKEPTKKRMLNYDLDLYSNGRS